MASHHESALLRPRDPSLLNSDYWPEFELKNVLVFDPDDPTASPANLLHAGAYRPLKITAKLEPPNANNVHAWLDNSVHRSVSIDITNVKEFSYGQYADGSLDIWAAGQAGWFAIRPARAYRETFNQMVQAVKLLYFMADTYKAINKYSDLPSQLFFQTCCEEGLDTCSSKEDAEALFATHRHFLIASMLTAKEGLQWARVPLYSYYHDTYPHDFQTVKQRINYKPSKSASRKGSAQSPTLSTASSRRKKATAKPRAATPKSAVSKRSTRSMRSTRSQSAATADSSLMAIDDSAPEHQQSLSTPHNARNHGNHDSASSSDDDDDQSQGPHGKGKGKSALRPRPSKYIPSRAHDSDQESPGAHNSHAATTSRSEHPDDMSIDSSSNEQSELSDKQTVDTDMEAGRLGAFQSPLPFRLQEAEENGDMWSCPTDGCMHKVYAASEASSQLLIKSHQDMHEFDHDERIQLVRRMEAPWLPVNRLMDRVREMAAQTKFPDPVVQRY